MASESSNFRKCVPPCPRYITGGDTHSLCVACLGAQHAQAALEGAACEHCERLPLRTLRSRRALFEEGASARVPRGSGPAAAEAERRLQSWGSRLDVAEGLETGAALSLPSPAPSSGSSRGMEARMVVSSPPRESPVLHLSSSEEVDVESIETEDSPLQSPACEELVEVLTRAVARLNIDWPTERYEAGRRRASKLDERFLPSRASEPQRRGLPFFHDLHTEVARSWKRPASYRVFSPQTSVYSNIAGLKQYGYGAMPKVEETLASHLSPSSASSLKAPSLPTRPLKTTSALVGKAYSAAGQAAACLHTMAIVQAYQADLLRDLDSSDAVGGDIITELRSSADLALRATKETARCVGRSMAALVATRHLWLNPTDIKEREKAFLLDAPLSPGGLFGDAVHTVTERFQESKKQAAALKQFLPLRVQVPGAAADIKQPKPSTSASHRAKQKQSVATRTPPQRGDEGRRSQTRPSRGRADLRTVLIAKKASSKRS
ncbi:uncharacterized protein [Pseudorasbora parva]|uniref:uncharacterized protein n=1 Tax=Pseudorasbora parva TaxID=51549 RepID=UPI00351E4DAF